MSQDLSQWQEVRNWLGSISQIVDRQRIEPLVASREKRAFQRTLAVGEIGWEESGWGTPTWPSEYGGGGLTPAEAAVLSEEMHAAGATTRSRYLLEWA